MNNKKRVAGILLFQFLQSLIVPACKKQVRNRKRKKKRKGEEKEEEERKRDKPQTTAA